MPTAFLGIAEHFHDWYLAGIEYNPLERANDGNKNLARFTTETDSLTILLWYDSVDENGDWPEMKLRFLGVYTMGFGPVKEPDPFYECWLEETARGWAFVGKDPLTDEERERPLPCRGPDNPAVSYQSSGMATASGGNTPGPSTGQGQTAIRRRPIGGPSGLLSL